MTRFFPSLRRPGGVDRAFRRAQYLSAYAVFGSLRSLQNADQPTVVLTGIFVGLVILSACTLRSPRYGRVAAATLISIGLLNTVAFGLDVTTNMPNQLAAIPAAIGLGVLMFLPLGWLYVRALVAHYVPAIPLDPEAPAGADMPTAT
jgi:hypothetical protein